MSTLAIKSCAIYIDDMNKTAPPANDVHPLDEFLCFSVYSAGLAFNRAYKPLLDRFGITYPQYLVLVTLITGDDQSVSELGNKLFLESNTLTPLIKRLETAGLVTRTRDNNDERIVRVSLTGEGRKLADTALGCVPAAIMEATDLDLEELSSINRSLAKLGHKLRQNC
jgi:MarR family transcriptional regulator, organic hydroperoxide resistance regulator